eukprot:CAMPEP_0198226878 /NCGR_PEP_ID=MMETSP1445-20131203/106958_1 /TAXON_ID=36898 /ORGANISM="Pyramimonas sp., Strain CCMP2087" /LENGTH=280 /DNA_ID=CAMNT_0043906785 /DNA_START=276 /DNA_END=1115 /DNA_ORIENTATION=-
MLRTLALYTGPLRCLAPAGALVGFAKFPTTGDVYLTSHSVNSDPHTVPSYRRPSQIPSFPISAWTTCRRAWCSSSTGDHAGADKKAPVEVRQTDSAGRGMFAARTLEAGEVLFRAEPAVAHPHLESQHTVCYQCLRPLLHQQCSAPKEQHSRQSNNFCGEVCHKVALGSYLRVQTSVDLTTLEEHCRATGVKFPLLIARLAFLCLVGQREPEALSMLCFAKVHQPPEEWAREHRLLRGALEQAALERAADADADYFGAARLAFLTEEWYVQQQARLHLNA